MSTSAIDAFNEVQESLESIKNDRTQRFPDAASVGDYVRQGDLLVHLIAGPEGEPATIPNDRQLVEGTSKGSRHCLSHDNVEFRARSGNALTGPCFCPREEVTVEHPEHGNWELPAGNWYGITYERAMGDELKRARD